MANPNELNLVLLVAELHAHIKIVWPNVLMLGETMQKAKNQENAIKQKLIYFKFLEPGFVVFAYIAITQYNVCKCEITIFRKCKFPYQLFFFQCYSWA